MYIYHLLSLPFSRHIHMYMYTALPQAIITDSEGEQDFVIVEDSSTDSEDEEEEDEV